jgi:tRNA(Ile)-lysidine synthase
LPQLAAEGGDVRNLTRLAARLARANAAVEVLADGAERFLALRDRGVVPQSSGMRSYDARAFAALPEEVRLRLLLRAINTVGHEGPAELGKVEALLAALDRAVAVVPRTAGSGRPLLKQTLAGALISLSRGRIHIAPAPVRRRSAGS